MKKLVKLVFVLSISTIILVPTVQAAISPSSIFNEYQTITTRYTEDLQKESSRQLNELDKKMKYITEEAKKIEEIELNRLQSLTTSHKAKIKDLNKNLNKSKKDKDKLKYSYEIKIAEQQFRYERNNIEHGLEIQMLKLKNEYNAANEQIEKLNKGMKNQIKLLQSLEKVLFPLKDIQ